MTSTTLAPLEQFELDQRRAKAYAESGYWTGMKLAQALVKIEAGESLGLPPLLAMNEVHVIDGKPGLGAGACAALVKASGRYDYRVVDLTNERCIIRFYDRGDPIGESVFTIKDAETAKLMSKGPWAQYPRNMLFARAMTNGMAWYCPDVAMGRIYTPDELGVETLEDIPEPAVELDEDPDIPFGDSYVEPKTVEAEIVEQLDRLTDERGDPGHETDDD
jgi:hypothetical protein